MRYAQASKGQVSYGTESTAYEQADNTDEYFGIVTEAVEVPNPNEVTPMATAGGRRGPHLNSPEARTYEFDVPFLVLDSNAPFEFALGDRETTDEDGYTKHLFTEADRLPTMTVEHRQDDVDFAQWFVGAKSSLDLSAEQGDPLEASMSMIAAERDYDDDADEAPNLSVPQDRSPFRFWMAGDVTLADPDDGDTVEELATVTGFDLSWDNGLEAHHTGGGRDAYAVVETTAAEKYDMSITATVTDTDLYARAAEDDAPVDVEIPFHRPPGQDDDALYVRLKECTVTSAPIPMAEEGVVETELELAPRDTEIEIREPNSA